MAENKAGVRFLNKIAIVTGGCQGVGKGILDVLLEQGGKVAVFDINDKLGSELTTSGPGIVKYVHCDVRNEAEVKRSIASVVEAFGGLDLLVNNAGYAPSVVRTPLLEEFASSLPDPQKQIKNWEDSVLLRRLAEPKEIGLACLYLAVDATFTTGFELNCTAGSEIGYGVKQ
ncbi:ZERSY-like protein [Mya arenaria]|uniref:ZERSY-like protein n=1 Tax=Mya arenaria TaxID=6604 RepID=A0ABY7GDZ8_MYAAR|nr:ZERSY-like protein [Mya arenaria]